MLTKQITLCSVRHVTTQVGAAVVEVVAEGHLLSRYPYNLWVTSLLSFFRVLATWDAIEVESFFRNKSFFLKFVAEVFTACHGRHWNFSKNQCDPTIGEGPGFVFIFIL